MENEIRSKLNSIVNKFDTLPFLFVGAGLSRRYLNAQSWEELLEEYAITAKNSEYGYRLYSEELKKYEDLPVGEKPKLATLIENDFNRQWLTDDRYEELRKTHEDKIHAGISPFKIDISNNLLSKSKNVNPDYNEEIELLKNLGNNNHIAGVITTNYDTFLESCFNDYDVYIGQNELIFSVIQGIGEIYKIHGCVTKPESIIINEKDYLEFVSKNAYLASKILTIFLEHPIIFIGYSIDDPNIEEILTSIVSCLDSVQLERLKDRFFFVEWNNEGRRDSIETFQKVFENGKRIEMTRLFIKDFSTLFQSLLLTKAKYRVPILRKLKQEIYDLVLTSKPSESLNVVIDADDDKKLEELEVVVGFGIIKGLAEKGYEGITVQDIYEDIIFDNKEFLIEPIIKRVLPTLLKRHSNSIPIYKYVKQYNGDLPEQISKEIKSNLDEFLNRNLIRKKDTIELEERTVSGIALRYELEKSLEYICLLDKDEIDLTELQEFLAQVYKEVPNVLQMKKGQISTNFRRVAKIYDWLMYGE